MKYGLDELAHLVHITLHPDNLNKQNTSAKQIQDWKDFAGKEKHRQLRLLISETFLLSEPQKTLYLHNYQSFLLQLVNTLRQYIVHEKIKDAVFKNVQLFYQDLSNTLEDLISFLEEKFSSYFNHDLPIPPVRKAALQNGLQKEIREITTRYDGFISTSFLDIVLRPLNEFIAEKESKTTYRTFAYYQELAQGLLKVKLSKDEYEMAFNLYSFLIGIDFNSPDHVAFATSELMRKLKELNTTTEQLNMLHWDIKFISQSANSARPGISLFPQQASFATQVIAWLKQEIQYIEETMRIEAGSAIVNHKVKTNLSAAQLILLFRQLVDCDAIQADNIKELTEHISRNYASKQTSDLSPDSLYSKYFKNDPGAAQALREIVIKMLNNLNSGAFKKSTNGN